MLKKIKEEWSKWTQLSRFKAYFEKTWLNRDVTLRRKLKVGALVEQLMVLCTSESVRARQFAASTTFSERLSRRARAMTRQGLLYEQQYERTSIAFLLSDAPSEQQSDSMNVVSIPCTRIFDVLDRRSKEDLPASAQLNVETAKMEHRRMPTCGWEVNVAARTCPCRLFMKHGACIHLLYCLNAVGSLDVKGRQTLFYRGTNKRKRAAAADEAASHAAGRPRHNWQALSIE
ncbi:hypothetical protein PHYSODRAFT_293692 [Phytophthora sojae]|uniref:SWIM-type domain-containing protein n=1 Tax=Phytophthora sojae (strain P6497) TaxID=1094619 RepID=G4YG04_PHYSP|nr:hypothetical protein PHYSODRAFT_293692 [Phytophthora sojae]EGZ28052.1 hypothetical protein PHYSODRAFT_293692 [Phytophthora sojae]|eukprot:XP_009515327.1 hypothetical protein PHYSODRAFT_293692 [Phytophthora sojae]